MPNPHPSIKTKTESSEFIDFLGDRTVGAFKSAFDFLFENIGTVLGAILTFGVLGFIYYKLHKKQAYIQKIWLYTLFFLTKRQMTIPLVYSLAKKDKVLDENELNELLEIRAKCRHVSLRKSPAQRLKLEKKVSLFLFDYFSTIEKEGKLRKGSRFERVVRDLEFIDKKLVDLQKFYNLEVVGWNKMVNIPILKYVFQVFRLQRFEKFKVSE